MRETASRLAKHGTPRQPLLTGIAACARLIRAGGQCRLQLWWNGQYGAGAMACTRGPLQRQQTAAAAIWDFRIAHATPAVLLTGKRSGDRGRFQIVCASPAQRDTLGVAGRRAGGDCAPGRSSVTRPPGDGEGRWTTQQRFAISNRDFRQQVFASLSPSVCSWRCGSCARRTARWRWPPLDASRSPAVERLGG